MLLNCQNPCQRTFCQQLEACTTTKFVTFVIYVVKIIFIISKQLVYPQKNQLFLAD